jgi:hypothetical protein
MDYEEKYKSLIKTFREWLINNNQYEDEVDFFKTASEVDIIDSVIEIMDSALKPKTTGMEFEIMRKEFSR